MIALSLFSRLCAALRNVGPALRSGYGRSSLSASSALWRVMAGGSAGV
ncbi:hypothetical protein SAMN05216359_11256 [Roseateles sp. YR242]|nr:hypothetical protein [Roseateles sp. YR242]SEL61444.1 hypothetical protein SAMN05216359_11256 [Roseateles sp. YR242]